MKTIAIVGLVAGLIGGTALVGYYGFAEVGHALIAVGAAGFLAIAAYHLVILGVLGLCWYVLVPGRHRLVPCLWGRLVRDSGAEVLPLSQLGGFIMGARAATLLGLSGITAFASTIVDVTVEMVAQLGFTAIGLAILKWQRPDDPLIDGAAVGVIVALVGAIGFIIAQRRGFAIADRVAGRLAAQWLKTAAARSRLVHDEIVGIYRRPKAIWLACLLHLAAWVAGSLQVWFALRLMGADVGIPAVIAIESLLYAIRSAAFFVPNALGVQEGAYIMLGGLFGVPPDIALALSLLKRARDLVVGVPSLVAWQAMESRRLMRNRAAETLQAGETRSP